MSPSVKLGLLTLVSSAAAVPHYGHSRFHKPSGGYGGPGTGSGAPYPTGGWHHNSTALPHPSGTGVYPEDKTTTLLETLYSTATVVSTVYATRPGGEGYTSVGAEDVSTGAAVCGPETVYVTATNKVTVTVPAGGASSEYAVFSTSSAYSYTPPASSAEAASSAVSSSAPVYEVPASSSAAPVSEAPISSSAVYEAPSTSAEAATPSSSAVEYFSVSIPNKGVDATSTVASSATPSATGSPSYSGGKRGLAYNSADLCSAFDNGKFSFAYNWASKVNGVLPDGVKFAPMARTTNDITAENWLKDVDTAVAAGSNVVMGFNEADHAAQANMAPAVACEAWKSYMQPIKSSHPDVTILGPSVTNGGAPMGLTWLEEFTNADACKGLSWDATNLHFYDIYDGGCKRLQTQIETAYSQFNKPVWVTEFGLNGSDGATDEQAADFLKCAMDYMDNSDIVQGYAYFMVGTGQYQLNAGTGLSTTGNTYVS